MSNTIKEISVHELLRMTTDKEDFQLIDVREPDEYAFANLSGELIPMNQIPDRVDEIEKNKKVIIMCRSGQRSAHVAAYLQAAHGMNEVYNLAGGILAYSDEIDNTIPKY